MMERREKKINFVLLLMMIISSQTPIGEAFDDEVRIRFSVPEEQATTSIVGSIMEQLKDPTIHLINFLLVKSSHSHFFSLDPESSVLSINQRIDREVTCEELDELLDEPEECVISLQVICKSPKNEFVVVRVEVVISDINDNTPIFPSDSVSIRVAEDLQVGTKLLIPSAKDADSKKFNIDYYVIQNCDDCRFLLEMESSPESLSTKLFIRSNDRMNRRLNQINFDVVAVDKGNPPLSGKLRVVVFIEETNQAPQFEKNTYQVTALEERMISQPLVKVQASDSDNGNNGRVEYYLAKPEVYGHVIEVNSRTGDVFLKNKLDYEVKNYYRIKILAKDMGIPPLSATTMLIIHVEDANDHPPKMTLTSEKNGDSQIIEVSENMKEPQAIAFISVSDDDQGNNANVSCHLLTHQELFSLTRIYSNIYSVTTLRQLDRESNPFYTLEVVCRDMGDPPLETVFDFNVNISDQNDNKPIFTEQYYHSEVFENSPKGTYLLDVAAVDLDINLNGEIRYYLEDNVFFNGMLVIDEVTGILTTGHQALDHETNASISFRVEARDLGHPPNSAFVTVTIDVLDTNDNPPAFKSFFNTLHISENALPNSFVHRFETSDNDKTDIYKETVYSLSCCNKSGKSCNVLKEIPSEPGQKEDRGRFLEYYTEEQLFSMVTMEGDSLYTNNYFDREVESVYHFCVYANNTHSPYPFSVAQVILEVDDVNDNPPSTIFPSRSYTLELSSWTPPEENVIQVIARDPDDGDNSLLKFSFPQLTNSPQSFFSINESNGMVILNTNLRETDYWNNTSFTFNYSISDSGSPALSTQGSFLVMIFSDEDKALYKAKMASTHPQSHQESSYNLFVILILCSSTLLLIAILSATICFIRFRGKKGGGRKDGLDEVEDECKINPSQVFLVDVSNDIYSHHNNNNNNNSNNNNNLSSNNNNSKILHDSNNDDDDDDDGNLINNNNNNNSTKNNVYFISANNTNNNNKNNNNKDTTNKNIETFETSPYNPKRHSYNQPCLKPKFANFSLHLQHQGNHHHLVHDSSPSSDSGKGQSEMEVSDTLKHPSISTINHRYSRYNGDIMLNNNQINPNSRGNVYGSCNNGNNGSIYNKGSNYNNYNTYNNQYNTPSNINNYNLPHINNHKQFLYGQERKDLTYGNSYCPFRDDRISEVSGTSPAIVSPEDPSCVETFI